MTIVPPVTGLHAVGVPVTDPDQAVAFYAALGFEVRLDVPMGEGTRWIEVALPGTTVTLGPSRPARDTRRGWRRGSG